ncbi:hypothetical protein [Terrimonas alba]|uniref:hypothetical protein n=1 Tax=Terrimonas alba TaxID=3349636 RepID=UPI0035F2ADE8
MKKIILLALVIASFTAQTQPIYVDRIGFKLESIADIDIGWMKIYKHTTPPKGKQLGNRTYSATQIGYSQQFVEWMQQSYLPKGCLGDAGYYQNAIPKFSGTNSRLGNAINMHGNALPHLYGAFSKMYMFLKKDDQGKFAPQNNLAEYWRIEANQLQYISDPVSFISSAEEYYFVLPDFNGNIKGYDADDKAASNLMDFNTHKNIKAYKHFYVPPKTIDDYAHYVVILTKDNELPFENVTIGDFFTEAEMQFPVWQKIDPVPAEKFAVAQKNLARLKEKYKAKWNDIAELQLSKTQINLYDFVNATEDHDDIFANKNIYGKEGVHTTFPILKVKKIALALCKTDQPQWLVIRWTMGMPNESFNNHLHESILHNFNFDYVYNFFFKPEKVKGQQYKPLRSPSFKEAVVVREASKTSKKITAEKNIFFFEDFSTTTPGKKPIGWQTKLANAGTTAVITQPDGLDGNWVELRGHYINATLLKKPLPQNFTFSYDLVASQNFTWGAKGLTMQLSKETSPGNAESYLKLKLRPGFDGRDGEAELERKFPFPPGYSNGTKWYVANGFSNNKKNNRITVTIKKMDEMLQVFIDKNKIAEYEKAIPAAHLFNALSFDCSGNSAENDKFYINNIKITKE